MLINIISHTDKVHIMLYAKDKMSYAVHIEYDR